MEVIKQLVGRLHPLIVHLPIGFIILGLLLQWFDRNKKEYGRLISLIYFWAAISAVAACITGYLQYLGEGYAFDTVKWHLWAGIFTTLFSFLIYARLKGLKIAMFLSKIPVLAFSILIFILISFTGHQGGTITHGEDYLTGPLPNSLKSALGFETFEEKTIELNNENWEKAILYEDVIKPILNNKCISCHGPKKSKGELTLHTPEGILKGGENGEIIVPKNLKESELYHRLTSPKEDEDHMPPKEKTQPSKEEIALVKIWIEVGNPFDKSIGELGLSKDSFLPFFPQKLDLDYPEAEITMASESAIDSIKKNGIHVYSISKTTNYLSVSCINKPFFIDSDFEILLPIATQIAILDLGNTHVSDAIFEKLVLLPSLTILKLDNTKITGKNIELLVTLEYLKSVNLTGSKFKEHYIQAFSSFKKLKKVFLYGTTVKGNGVQTMKEGQITLDYGSYELPRIAADSIIY